MVSLGGRRPSPHRGREVTSFPENPTLGPASAAIPLLMGRAAGPSQRGHDEYPTAEADRGRHPGFPSFNVIAGAPGSLAERSAANASDIRVSLRLWFRSELSHLETEPNLKRSVADVVKVVEAAGIKVQRSPCSRTWSVEVGPRLSRFRFG